MIGTTQLVRAVGTSTEFPYGQVKNSTYAGAGDGTPVDNEVIQDIRTLFDYIVDQAGVTPNGVLDNATDGFQLRTGFETYLNERYVKNGGNTGSETQLITKAYQIGTWNMNTTSSVSITHGLSDWTKVRGMTASIINDDEDKIEDLSGTNANDQRGGLVRVRPLVIELARTTGGNFDNTSYNSASITNRGWVLLTYEA